MDPGSDLLSNEGSGWTWSGSTRPYKWRHTHLLFEGSAGGEPWLDDLGGRLQPHVRPVQREVKRVRRPPAVHYGVPNSHLPGHNLWRQSSYVGGKELPYGCRRKNSLQFLTFSWNSLKFRQSTIENFRWFVTFLSNFRENYLPSLQKHFCHIW